MEDKKNVISDKAEKELAQSIIKQKNAENFKGNGRGHSEEGFPLIPVGSSVFLKYNLKDDGKIIGVDTKDQKTKDPYFTVIGVGATASTVNVGDRIILKPTASVETYITDNLPDIKEFKYHTIYETAILAILK